MHFSEFCESEKMDSIDYRRRFKIATLMQKMKMNLTTIPDNWYRELTFIRQQPTGRLGWKIKSTETDQKIFFKFASDIYNNCSTEFKNLFTLSSKQLKLHFT